MSKRTYQPKTRKRAKTAPEPRVVAADAVDLPQKGADDGPTFTKDEYESLKEDVEWLRCLEAAGVDNWDGIDYASDLLEDGGV